VLLSKVDCLSAYGMRLSFDHLMYFMFLLLQGMKFVKPSGCFTLMIDPVVGGHFSGLS
jgi:hypothetical protein